MKYSQKKEDAIAKVRRKKTRPRLETSRNAVFFQWFVRRVSWKVGSLQRRGQERNQKLHAAVARSNFQVKVYKTRQVWSTFWSSDVKKFCGALARSAFSSENVQNIAVPMSKNCTPLWREAHFQVKMLKDWQSRSTFWSSDVEKLHAAVARSTCVSQNVQNTCVLAHFVKFRCRKITQLASSSVNQSVR